MEPRDLLEQWRKGIRIWHIAHSRAAARFERRGRLLGVPVIALSALVGSTLFAAIGESPADGLKLGAGLLSALAAVLAGLQTFLAYPELAERHKRAAQRYGELRREVEVHLAAGLPADPKALLEELRTRWDTLDRESPSPPQALYDQARGKVAEGRGAGR